MPEHVGCDAGIRRPGEEAVDLLASRCERHRPVQHRDATGVKPVELAREREHGLATEGDDHRARRESAQLARPDELERQLALVHAELGVGERPTDERERVERPEQPHVPVVPGEEQLRPCRSAFLVVGPLDLVEHERLARSGRHLDRAAEDRGRVVQALLPGDEPDPILPEKRRKPPVRLLREHPQGPGVDASAVLGEERERIVRLAGVRRAQVGDDRFRRTPSLGQPDLDLALRALHRRALVRPRGAGMAGRARRPPRRS